MESSSVYMCFPCYQEFNTLDEVLQHQLTCTAEATEPVVAAPGMTTINAPLRHTQVFGQLIAPAESIVATALQNQAADASKKLTPTRQHAAASALSDQPRILYQCGDCDELFKSLDLWQQHRKEGSCLQPDITSSTLGTNPGGTEVEVEVEPKGEGESEYEYEDEGEPVVKAEPEQEAVSQPGPDESGSSVQPGSDEIGSSEQPCRDETGSSVQPGPDESGSSVQPGPDESGSSTRPGPGKTGSSAQPGPDETGSSAQTPEEARDHSHAVTTAAKKTKRRSAKEASGENSTSAQNSEPPDEDDNEDVEEEEPSTYRRRGLIKKVKPEALLLCVDCGASFGLVSELVAHRKSQHGLEEALHRCFVCGESFLNTTLFLYHRKQHQQKDPSGREGVVVEDIVLDAPPEEESRPTQSNGLEEQQSQNSSSATTTTISSSIPNFTRAESFLCTLCGVDFNTDRALGSHRREKHGLQEPLHHCPQCALEFMNTTRYLYHLRTHRAEEADALTDLQRTPRKRLLSPTNSLSESVSPSPKRVRPHTGSSPVKDEIREPEDSTNLPPPAKLLQDWARTSLPHVCPHCGKTFTRRVFLRAHVFSHTGEKLFTCKVCKKSFSNSQSLLRHTMNHMGTKPYHCEQCGKNFTQATNLRRHQRTHVSGEPPRKRGRKPRVYTLDIDGSARLFPCDHCPSRFNTEDQLNHHKLLHTTHPFPCPECGVAFKRRKELDLHSLSHQDKEPATCEHCNSQFINQSVLDIHLQRCPTNEQDRNMGRGRGQGRGRCTGQVECDLCGHRCMTQEGLDLHRLSHTGQTPLKCPVTPCRRRFASSGALEEHMVAHIQGNVVRSKGRPRFSCDICFKEFAYTSTFNVHMRTHTDERPFECTVCNKRFRQLPHLQDHERIHSGVRPFSCWVCGKSFSVAARLTEHARTHSGEKPYPCTHCAAAFRSRSNLDKHLRLHGDLPAPAADGAAQELAAEEALKAAQVAQVQRVLEGAKVLTSLATTGGGEMEAGTVQTIYVLQTGGEGGTETMMIPSDQLGMVEGTNQVVFLPSGMLGAGQTITMPTITVGGQEITMVQQSQADEHGAIEFIVEETV